MKGKPTPIVMIDCVKHITRFFSSPIDCERQTGVNRCAIFRALRSPSGYLQAADCYVDYACEDYDVEKYEMKGDEDYGV